jgi:hypothetical protein
MSFSHRHLCDILCITRRARGNFLFFICIILHNSTFISLALALLSAERNARGSRNCMQIADFFHSTKSFIFSCHHLKFHNLSTSIWYSRIILHPLAEIAFIHSHLIYDDYHYAVRIFCAVASLFIAFFRRADELRVFFWVRELKN